MGFDNLRLHPRFGDREVEDGLAAPAQPDVQVAFFGTWESGKPGLAFGVAIVLSEGLRERLDLLPRAPYLFVNAGPPECKEPFDRLTHPLRILGPQR